MKTRDLKMSIEPINIRFPDATNEILEPFKSPFNDEDLETSNGGEDEQLQMMRRHEQLVN